MKVIAHQITQQEERERWRGWVRERERHPYLLNLLNVKSNLDYQLTSQLLPDTKQIIVDQTKHNLFNLVKGDEILWEKGVYLDVLSY